MAVITFTTGSSGGGAPTGSASGDLTGTYPGPTIAAGALTNAGVNAAAAIAYSKLNLAASVTSADIVDATIVNADIAAAAAIAVTKLADPTTGFVIGSTSNAAAAVRPPGFLWSYTEITANANATDTSEATATALISPSAFTPDGALVKVELYVPRMQSPSAATGNSITPGLWEGATQITRLGSLITTAPTAASAPSTMVYYFTPTNASHTYKICAVVTNTTGTPTFGCGAGGTGTLPPAFVRFTKA